MAEPNKPRLKILGKKCRFAALPPAQWLHAPGALRSESKLGQLEEAMNAQLNHGHLLVCPFQPPSWVVACPPLPLPPRFPCPPPVNSAPPSPLMP